MKLKFSTVIPAILLIYLAVMSYIGYPEYEQGHYLYYFSVIGITLIIIVILHLFLRRREAARSEANRRRDSRR